MITFFKSVGLTEKDIGVKINSRKVLSSVLESAGISSEKSAAVCVIIDKVDKIGPNAVREQLVEKLCLDASTAKRVMDFTESKSVEEFCSKFGDEGKEGVASILELFEYAEAYGFRDWLQFDASVVRGLAYYTGIVWEAFDRRGELRAIAGGGRYDELLSVFGSPVPIPSVGFGFGDCVIYELLQKFNKLPACSHTVDYVVAAYKGMYSSALRVASELRQTGATVDVLMEAGKRVDRQFKYADRVGARRIAFVAPNEWELGKVRIKDLRSGSQLSRSEIDVPLDDIANVDGYFT